MGFEREAAQLAAERRTTEDLEQIQCYLDKCKETLKNNDMSQFAKLDIAFHKSIVKATHNGMFIELYEHITDALQNSIEEFVDIKSPVHVENGIHTDLFQAIRLGDKQWALECVNEYLDDAKESLSLRGND